MTQLRCDKGAISNYFDRLVDGIGKRGSSFTDLDAVSHDMDDDRILIQEFKQDGERLHPSQRMTLVALARRDGITVWFVRILGAGRIGFAEFGAGQLLEVISESEYTDRFRRWWYPNAVAAPVEVAASASASTPEPTAAEINW